MAKYGIIQTGGKQYIVSENEELYVQKIEGNEKDTVEFETLGTFDEKGSDVAIGEPLTGKRVKAEVIEQTKGDKIRVARFKAKVRYRKVKGFRPELTKVKITAIA